MVNKGSIRAANKRAANEGASSLFSRLGGGTFPLSGVIVLILHTRVERCLYFPTIISSIDYFTQGFLKMSSGFL